MNERMVIVGAGQAGLQIAESLRAEGFDGAIELLAGEKSPPYQRPPLSKAWLQGDLPEERLFLRGAEALAAKNIDLRLGAVVTEIDRAGKAVRLADGSSLTYSGLALATGARARRPALPGADLAGVCVLRDMADAREISHRMDAANSSRGDRRRLHRAGGRGDRAQTGSAGHRDRGSGPVDGPRRHAAPFHFFR